MLGVRERLTVCRLAPLLGGEVEKIADYADPALRPGECPLIGALSQNGLGRSQLSPQTCFHRLPRLAPGNLLEAVESGG